MFTVEKIVFILLLITFWSNNCSSCRQDFSRILENMKSILNKIPAKNSTNKTTEDKKPEYYVEFPPEEGEINPERKQLDEFERRYRSLISANPRYEALLSEVRDYMRKPLPQCMGGNIDQSCQTFHPRQAHSAQQQTYMNYNSRIEDLDNKIKAIQNLLKRK
ncbi:uncharacterized protein LOC116341259 [Contarinia nasturtii]|uniref:uncharacterized protein LOC116341259 n=1 Tax=Contarinia nasturtii TaxID=265458 RepID=UPI0012D4866F|nr:uncharacterized protein LOC116341259 [Contarinia nasturtii]XP_031624076.1 uncharacterized protein LOC116341259 [Contarinia nasturtii]